MQFASGIQNPDSGFVRYNVARTEGFNGYACAPLIARGTFLGILEIYTKSGTELSGSQKSHIGALAEQTAIAIDSISSFKNLQITNERLYNAYDANISGWSRALDYRDKETEGHSRRVTDIAVALAQKAGISEEMLKYVRWGALLHDIGKMGIPDSILLKPGKLNADEW
ncbi:MAG: HD-GYP domain-containing protein, partial [Spirochaetota bacterium]